MTEQERVIKGLEETYQKYSVNEGQGILVDKDGYEYALIDPVLINDTLALLKVQEPVEPKWVNGMAFCGWCNRIFVACGYNYCPDCGRKVKWGD